MLIPFYLDEHFFDSVYFYDEDYDSAHDNFLKFWENYGVLIYSNNQNIIFYRDLIKKFPLNFHQRWNAALIGFSKFDINNESLDKFKDCKESFKKLASKKNFYNLGLTDKDSFKLVQNLKDFEDYQDFEVRCLENYTTSAIYNNTLLNATCIINDGEEIEKVWDKKFKNLLKYTSSVTILDRYLFKNIGDDFEARETNIKNFFKLLSKCSVEKINLTIISNGGVKNSETYNFLIGYFSSKIANVHAFRKIIDSLNIYSVEDSFFQQKLHDRFVICDKHFCSIGAGFELFRSYPVSNTACTLAVLRESSLRSIVHKAKKSALWKEEIL